MGKVAGISTLYCIDFEKSPRKWSGPLIKNVPTIKKRRDNVECTDSASFFYLILKDKVECVFPSYHSILFENWFRI